MNIKKDIRQIERDVFDHASESLVREIMIKKRNIMLLKNMFEPQVEVLKGLELQINKLFK